MMHSPSPRDSTAYYSQPTNPPGPVQGSASLAVRDSSTMEAERDMCQFQEVQRKHLRKLKREQLQRQALSSSESSQLLENGGGGGRVDRATVQSAERLDRKRKLLGDDFTPGGRLHAPAGRAKVLKSADAEPVSTSGSKRRRGAPSVAAAAATAALAAAPEVEVNQEEFLRILVRAAPLCSQ